MSQAKKYRTTLKNCTFCYQETRRIAQLLQSGWDKADVQKKIQEEDLLQLPSADRRRVVGREIFLRLEQLDEEMQQMLLEEDIQTSKALVLYSILCADQLFYEFVREVYLNKKLTFRTELTRKEVKRFVERKAGNDKQSAKWTEKTRSLLAGAFIQVLAEAGWLMERDQENYHLTFPSLSLEATDYLRRQGYLPAVEMILGERL